MGFFIAAARAFQFFRTETFSNPFVALPTYYMGILH